MQLTSLPVAIVASTAVAGVLGVTAFVVKTKSNDHQHLIDAHTKALEIDAEKQSNMLTVMKEMTTKTLV